MNLTCGELRRGHSAFSETEVHRLSQLPNYLELLLMIWHLEVHNIHQARGFSLPGFLDFKTCLEGPLSWQISNSLDFGLVSTSEEVCGACQFAAGFLCWSVPGRLKPRFFAH